MWTYDKKLQYPVKIKNPNPAYAKIIMDQYGGLFGKKILKIKNRRFSKKKQNTLERP